MKHWWSCNCFWVSCLLKHKVVTAPDCFTRESCQPVGRLPAVFVMNQAEDRRMLPVGFKLLDVRQKITQTGVQKHTSASS